MFPGTSSVCRDKKPAMKSKNLFKKQIINIYFKMLPTICIPNVQNHQHVNKFLTVNLGIVSIHNFVYKGSLLLNTVSRFLQ